MCTVCDFLKFASVSTQLIAKMEVYCVALFWDK